MNTQNSKVAIQTSAKREEPTIGKVTISKPHSALKSTDNLSAASSKVK